MSFPCGSAVAERRSRGLFIYSQKGTKMRNPSSMRRSVVILALSGTAFALHWAGCLETLVLWIAGVCGAIAAVRLLETARLQGGSWRAPSVGWKGE